MTQFANVPKHILTDVYIGMGPMGGPYAKPCYCGEPMDLSEQVAFMRGKDDGDIMICHPECVKGMDPDA